MKIKSRTLLLVCAILLFAVASAFAFALAGGGTTVYAATTPKYQLKYDYDQYYHRNTGLNLWEKGLDVYSSVLNCKGDETTEVNLYIYGDSFTETISGNYVSLTEGTLQLDADFPNCKTTVTDNTGTVIAEGDKRVAFSGLSEGRYHISADLTGEQWDLDENTVAWYSVALTATFYVDVTPPTMAGASLSKTGLYTKARSTVTASDNAAVESIYMKEPNSDGYSAVGTSVTLPEKSADGLYSFYAKDMAGNVSATYYIYYDITPPTGEIKNANGEVVDTVYTNQAFCYVATDSGSGIRLLQIQNPSQSLWTNYVSGALIQSTATNGKYTFRSIDKCGTISEEKIIYLDTTAPTVTVYHDDNAVIGGSTVSGGKIGFVPSDELSGVKDCYVKTPDAEEYAPYAENDRYDEIGTYFFYCTDVAGNISQVYRVSLSGTPEEGHTHEYTVQTFAPDCTSDGYTIYTCSCGDSYTDELVKALGHDYAAWQTTIDATCTLLGVRESVCTRCGDRLTENIPALGHSYDLKDVAPTCTETGYTLHTCSQCGDSFATDFLEATGHSFGTEQTLPATCTERGYVYRVCEDCGNEEVLSTAGALGHSYTIEIANRIEPTCSREGGYDTVTFCERCGQELVRETAVIPATGHGYEVTYTWSTDYGRCTATKVCRNDSSHVVFISVNTDCTTIHPSCTEAGEKVYSAKFSSDEFEDQTYAVTLPATGHSPSNWIVDAEADCTHGGNKHRECTTCGTVLELSVIPAVGHTETVDRTVTATCTQTGLTEGSHCSVCGAVLSAQEIVEKIEHTPSEWRIDKEATCEEAGCRHIECTVCRDILKTEAVAKLPHTAGEWIVDAEADCTHAGSRHKECAICGAVLEISAISAEGHDFDPIGVQWIWAEDYSSATVLLFCANDRSHVQRLPATVTGETVAATATEGSYVVYTARVGTEGGVLTDERVKQLFAPQEGSGCANAVFGDGFGAVALLTGLVSVYLGFRLGRRSKPQRTDQNKVEK